MPPQLTAASILLTVAQLLSAATLLSLVGNEAPHAVQNGQFEMKPACVLTGPAVDVPLTAETARAASLTFAHHRTAESLMAKTARDIYHSPHPRPLSLMTVME